MSRTLLILLYSLGVYLEVHTPIRFNCSYRWRFSMWIVYISDSIAGIDNGRLIVIRNIL